MGHDTRADPFFFFHFLKCCETRHSSWVLRALFKSDLYSSGGQQCVTLLHVPPLTQQLHKVTTRQKLCGVLTCCGVSLPPSGKKKKIDYRICGCCLDVVSLCVSRSSLLRFCLWPSRTCGSISWVIVPITSRMTAYSCRGHRGLCGAPGNGCDKHAPRRRRPWRPRLVCFAGGCFSVVRITVHTHTHTHAGKQQEHKNTSRQLKQSPPTGGWGFFGSSCFILSLNLLWPAM